MQRDLLLVPHPESLAQIQEVRTQFDPLALKVPPHVTLLEPEPKAKIQNDYLKKLSLDTLPKLNELTFEKVVIHNSVYLWLMPSFESAERIRIWRDVVVQRLPQPNPSGEEFIPHITLGYLSRDLPAEEALKIVREKLRLPVTLVFAKLLLEEFGDNQVSVQIDSWPL
jgi:2'-5' RNA ligase